MIRMPYVLYVILLWWIRSSHSENNLIQRIRQQINATMSTTWDTWDAMKAVDFNGDTNPNRCNCCAGAHLYPSWWRLDLGNVYPIKMIEFIGRNDGHDPQTTGFLIYKIDGDTETLIYKDRHSWGNHFLIKLDRVVLLKTLLIKDLDDPLTICELKLTESENCPVGSYGVHCELLCHCADKRPCNRSTGICYSVGCEAGWTGSACTIDLNLIRQIRNDVTVSMSKPYIDDGESWAAERAIDFIENHMPNICHCCSSTTATAVKFWRLNLNNIYPIKTIMLYRRTDGGVRQLRYFKVLVSHTPEYNNTTLVWQNWAINDAVYIKTFNSPILIQYLEVRPTYSSENALTICEIRLIEGDCPLGKFDRHCSSICHCIDMMACNKTNGLCQYPGCAPGWRGPACNEECDVDWFGANCSSECHCQNSDECNHITGVCPSGICSSGWQGSNCSLACYKGTFGQNCLKTCKCLHNVTCNSVDGSCPSGLCLLGWGGDNCSLECNDGTFGVSCSSKCHCADDGVCNRFNGSCVGNLCETGWSGDNCSIGIQYAGTSNGNSSPSVFIGIGTGVLVLIVIMVLVVTFWRQKRQNYSKEQNTSDMPLKHPNNVTEPRNLFEERKSAITNLKSSINDTQITRDEHTYYAFEEGKKILITDLWDYLISANTYEYSILYKDFEKLPQGLVHDCDEARKPENYKKNRYKELYAYDHSRVVLHKSDSDASSYINACYIDGYDKQKKFIASQGPTKDMVDDFWEMVFQENISLIVMLTNVLEHGVRKCIQYWDPEEGEEITFGETNIKTNRISVLPDYVVRELSINKPGYVSREITHAHFTAWLDKDVPDVARHLVNFWRSLGLLEKRCNGPILVHCSAGVGRTGTYIALDNLHAQARTGGYIQPFETVEKMRHQRVNMVQTKEQYVFLHEAIAEASYISLKPVKTNEFEAVYKTLLHVGKPGEKAGLEQQFQLIQNRKTYQPENEYCNFTSVSDNMDYQPKLSTTANSVKMCYIQNHSKKKNLILAQLSDAADARRLQGVINENQVQTIISSQDIDTEENMKQGKRNIKQFLYCPSENSSAISAGKQTAIDILNAVQKWQASVGDNQPVLLIYRSASGGAGIMCLLLIEFERIREKGEVHILETVKHMKQRNPEFFTDYEDYKYCYSVVLEYIRQSDVYMNV